MKKIICLFTALLLSFSFLFACASNNKGDEADKTLLLTPYVVLTPEEEYVGGTVLAYMEHAKSEGIINYAADDSGFITSINGISNSTSDNMYWMLYTDDADNSTPAWGAVTYLGTVYYSASTGADTLTVSQGKTYIWAYTKV